MGQNGWFDKARASVRCQTSGKECNAAFYPPPKVLLSDSVTMSRLLPDTADCVAFLGTKLRVRVRVRPVSPKSHKYPLAKNISDGQNLPTVNFLFRVLALGCVHRQGGMSTS